MLRFHANAVTVYHGSLAYISSEVLDRGLGYWYNVYTTAIQIYLEVFHYAQDRSHFSQD